MEILEKYKGMSSRRKRESAVSGKYKIQQYIIFGNMETGKKMGLRERTALVVDSDTLHYTWSLYIKSQSSF